MSQVSYGVCSVRIWEKFNDTLFYSETTWAVGIAQLTHHEVQGGGIGLGIFAPTADRVVS